MGLSQEAQACQGQVSRQLLTRAASFLLLADSQASFAIEGQRPPQSRLERWGRAVVAAGQRPLSLEALEHLHAILLADDRFVKVGLRDQGVFLGERTRDGEPLPEFVGAPHEALPRLMAAWLACHRRMTEGGLDPVLHAAALAFGFVYLHPLQDGNGRIHRCLIHQVLAERRYTPEGLTFPVSSVMAEELGAYRELLRAAPRAAARAEPPGLPRRGHARAHGLLGPRRRPSPTADPLGAPKRGPLAEAPPRGGLCPAERRGGGAHRGHRRRSLRPLGRRPLGRLKVKPWHPKGRWVKLGVQG